MSGGCELLVHGLIDLIGFLLCVLFLAFFWWLFTSQNKIKFIKFWIVFCFKELIFDLFYYWGV